MTTDGETRTVSFCVSAAEAASINGDSKTGREEGGKSVTTQGKTATTKVKSRRIGAC